MRALPAKGSVARLILVADDLSKDALLDLYFHTGVFPVEKAWLLDSIGGNQLLEPARFALHKGELFEDSAWLQTQNSVDL